MRATSGRRSTGICPPTSAFPIDVHAHEANTIYSVPMDPNMRVPPEGKLRVYRSKSGGNEWEPLTKGLPQENCYVNVLRDSMSVDSLDHCGIYFGTSGGQVYCSADGGDSWTAIVRDLPYVLSVEVQTIKETAMIRVLLPYHLRMLAKITGEVQLEVDPPVSAARSSSA